MPELGYSPHKGANCSMPCHVALQLMGSLVMQPSASHTSSPMRAKLVQPASMAGPEVLAWIAMANKIRLLSLSAHRRAS